MFGKHKYKDDLLSSFKAMTIKTRDIMAQTVNNPQPMSTDGTTLMCLSYHLKGICNERCGHWQPHFPQQQPGPDLAEGQLPLKPPDLNGGLAEYRNPIPSISECSPPRPAAPCQIDQVVPALASK
jgi:hypothetical protein